MKEKTQWENENISEQRQSKLRKTIAKKRKYKPT